MVEVTQLVCVLISVALSSALQRQSLNGQWTATGGPTEISIPNATVPGGIFSDLINHGDISDVFFGNGDTDYSWVGENNWTYSRTFTVDDELLAHRIVYIVFEGLDTFATISINGNEIGSTENMFRRYVFDIKEHLQVGANEISIEFASAVTKANDSFNDPSVAYLPPDCPPPEVNGFCYINLIRKMPAAFSWDWGPAFASAGIWKDVYLEAFDSAVIDYVVVTPSKDPETNRWSLIISTYLDAGGLTTIPGVLLAIIHLGDRTQTMSVNVEPRLNENSELVSTTVMDIADDTGINLWWPNGYGTQYLYDLNVSFIATTEVDDRTIKVGFRTIEIVQNPLLQGLTFYFKVNGQPIFAKGANEIPISILPEKGQDPTTVRNLLQSARDVNMNMIRIWGGGVYESDYFYDLADEYGILIWQDFMFTSAAYPGTDAFLENVAEEVRHQIKRLGSHPCIAMWCGNNESEAVMGLFVEWDDYERYKEDYVKLYVSTIAAQLGQIKPKANYVSSAPSNGLRTVQENYVAQDPQDIYSGDVHFYDYWSDSWDVSTFQIPRFASEYGYQSMPCVESWLTATDSVDDMHPDSDFLLHRQHHIGGNTENLNLIDAQMQMPDTSNENYVKAFIYFSQILQAQAIKTETEHYRSFKGRLNSDWQGYTMGALYWQLNDVWLAPSWSGIDFTGRWKMLHYQARDFFNPMIVTGRLTDDDLEIYAIYDGVALPDAEIKTVFYVYRWNSLQPLISIEFPVTLDLLQSVPVTTIDAPTTLITAGCGSDYNQARQNCFFHLRLMDQDNNVLAPFNYVFPEKLKNCTLSNANVQINSVTSADDEGTQFDVVITVDAVALFVWLDSHDIRGTFSDNGFLQVDNSKTVHFTSDEVITVGDLTAAVTVTHLRDPAYL